MSLDVIDLRDFYSRPLGQMARRILRVKLRARWKDVRGMRVLGYGFATPYLGSFREEAERVMAFMPAEQGVVDWPFGEPCCTGLVLEDMWPLPDSSVDRILLVHAVENAGSAGELLRECWRCLAPGGRLMVVVTNRRAPWSSLETTPFGQGKPFSRAQLTALLRESAFTPEGWTEGLMFPPIEARIVLGSAVALERFGARLWPVFAGVHMVEASKQVYRPIPARQAKRLTLKGAPIAVGSGVPAPMPPG
jgi:SAM-dependent methyltransferase